MTPGEMESVVLKADVVAKMHGEVTVEAEEEQA